MDTEHIIPRCGWRTKLLHEVTSQIMGGIDVIGFCLKRQHERVVVLGVSLQARRHSVYVIFIAVVVA